MRGSAQEALLALLGFWITPPEAATCGDATACEVVFDLVEAGRIEGEKAVPFLGAVLANPKVANRGRAAKLLAGGGYGLALVVPALLAGMKDEDAALRAACAVSLRTAVGAKPAAAAAPEIRGALLEAMDEEACRDLAAELLEVALLARPEVVTAMEDEAERRKVLGLVEARMRGKFIAALGKTVDGKIREQSAEDAGAKWAAFAETLVRAAPLSGFALAPYLDPKAGSEVARGMIRTRAIEAMVHLGPGALPALHETFRTGSDGRCTGAFDILRAISTEKKHAGQREAIAAAYREDRETAAAAGAAVSYLVAQLDSEKPAIRERTARMLELMGPTAKKAVAALTRTLEMDPASREVEAPPGFGETGPAKFHFVRAAAAVALGEVGAAAKSAIPALEKALKDARLRPAAFEALQKIRAAVAAASVEQGPKERVAAWRVTLADGKVLEVAEVETYERRTGTMVKIVRTDGMVLHLRKDEVKIERIAPGDGTPGEGDAPRVAIRLKDGRTFAGRLLEETDEKIVIEYQRGSIKMRMTFQKADVKTITRGEEKTE